MFMLRVVYEDGKDKTRQEGKKSKAAGQTEE